MRRSRRLIAFLSVFLIVGVLVAGCAKKEEPQPAEPAQQPAQSQQPSSEPAKPPVPQEIIINLGTDPPSLDPALATDTASFEVLQAVMEGLTRVTLKGTEPGMAESWTTSDDGLKWTFKLRDAKWSNGDPVKASDFVYAWSRALDPRTASEYAYQLYYIKGGEALNTIELPEGYPDVPNRAEVDGKILAAMEALGLNAPDDRTLVVELETATPYFLSLTSFITYYPVHPGVVENTENWASSAETFVGNGPFKMSEYIPKDKLVVVKNPDYWDAAAVKLEKIDWRMVEEDSTAFVMFENDELHLAAPPLDDVPRLLAEGKAKRAPLSCTYAYLFNVEAPPFNDPKVRQAFSYAIDRQSIADNVLKGGQLPAYAWTPPGLSKNPATGKDFREEGGDYFSYDPEKAKALLAEAGYPNGQGLPDIVLSYNTSEGHKKIAEAVQQMWAQNLGVTNVTLQNFEWAVHLSNLSNGDFQVARYAWCADYGDPMTFLDMWVTDGGHNDTNWSNPTYDSLIEKAKTTGDQAVRFPALHEAEKIVMTEMPFAPVYFYVRIYVQKDWIKDVYRDPVYPNDYKYAYVEAH